MQAALPRRSYDHRVREAICESRDPDLFPELQIPGSTIRCWLHRGAADVETADVLNDDRLKLLTENRELQRRVAFLGAMVGVLVALIRVSKSRLDFERIPDPNSKRVILRAIERSKKAMPLNSALRLAGISTSRYHSWCRAEEGCDLEDQPSCPRTMPSRLSLDEVAVIETMVASRESSIHVGQSSGSPCSANREGVRVADDVVSPDSAKRLEASSDSRLSSETKRRSSCHGTG